MERALVLGGGGHTGGAWEIGVLAGLADAGVDLTDADLLVGTSAGAVMGAWIASGTPVEEIHERQSAPYGDGPTVEVPFTVVARFLWAMLAFRTPKATARHLGRMALAARTVPEEEALRTMGAMLPVRDWPDRPLRVAAADAHTGEVTAFHSGSGVDLLRAVTASGTLPGVWPPLEIGGRRWIDGGVRSTTNADLARGCRRIVILAPVAKGPGVAAARHAAELRADGSKVALLTPDAAARRAFGRDALDPARRGPAARAGRAQAAGYAEAVAEVWRG
ncbi:patatin-like phospholipase family protein [Streptomyces taklimakanensis]|uniref:patatin-like phospholipase family protein n=1 Tax=Streptomyces taklimakanensis TaxID=2569853 RepID=UPI0030845B1A